MFYLRSLPILMPLRFPSVHAGRIVASRCLNTAPTTKHNTASSRTPAAPPTSARTTREKGPSPYPLLESPFRAIADRDLRLE
jgi:hypothetical protein